MWTSAAGWSVHDVVMNGLNGPAAQVQVNSRNNDLQQNCGFPERSTTGFRATTLRVDNNLCPLLLKPAIGQSPLFPLPVRVVCSSLTLVRICLFDIPRLFQDPFKTIDDIGILAAAHQAAPAAWKSKRSRWKRKNSTTSSAMYYASSWKGPFTQHASHSPRFRFAAGAVGAML